MQQITSDTLLQALNWRYATKAFDPARRIPANTWAALEQALVLSPSSFGLQPWRFVVVQDPALRARLREHSWGQAQITDASHLVVFAAKTDLTSADVDHFIARTAEVRKMDPAGLKGYRDMMVGNLVEGPRHAVIQEWAARQTYIAFGNLMTSAALLGIDACPIEGLDPAKYDEILGLPAQGYQTLAVCALGYRATADKYATLAKVRYPIEEVVVHR